MPSSSAGLPAAVVLNLFGTGLGIARSLGRRGVHVVGISSRADAPGNASRYCRGESGPDSQEAPEDLARHLLAVGARLGGRPVVFPTRDADLLFLDRFREVLSPRFELAVPARDTLAVLMDKDRLAKLAESHGIDTPRTRRIDSADGLEAARGDLVYPAVIKPVYANDWRKPGIWEAVGGMKGVMVRDHDACRQAYARIGRLVPEALVQEWIPGPESAFFVLGVVAGRGGSPLAAFTARKVLQYPPGFGLGCLVRAEAHPEVHERGLALLRAVGYRGVAEVEFKLDARTRRFRLIEINPRHWDQHNLGRAVGVDVPWVCYRDLCGLDPEPPARPGGRAIWLHGGGLVGCLKDALRSGDAGALRSLASIPFSRRVYAFWDRGDRGPFLAVVRAGRRARRRAS